MNRSQTKSSPHVVIVGGGFGGLRAARSLRKSSARITLVDRNNYHLFQPLLYQVATGALSPANIAAPLRSLVSKQKNCEVLLAEVIDFDVTTQKLILADGELQFDILVVAAGATHSYFGREEWEKYAPGLKSITEALDIRRRIFLAFEEAERETDHEARQALMTFAVIGGGPTGVELAGALSEIARHTLKHDFRRIQPENARILLIEAAPHVLNHYPEKLCEKAAAKIRSLGIELHTQTKLTELNENEISLSSPDGTSTIATRTVLWAAGVQANPLGKKLAAVCGVETDRTGRIPVTDQLHLQDQENIFVIGDLAAVLDNDGNPLPGLAPVAMQEGKHVAKVIRSRLEKKSPPKPFSYRDKGSMATIGRAAAVAQIGKRQFCGFFAWLLWLVIHLLQIVQFQNRILILWQWMWYYMTFNRSARIITGETSAQSQHSKAIDTPTSVSSTSLE